MRFVDLRKVAPADVRVGRWAVVFSTVDALDAATALGARFGAAPVVACGLVVTFMGLSLNSEKQ